MARWGALPGGRGGMCTAPLPGQLSVGFYGGSGSIVAVGSSLHCLLYDTAKLRLTAWRPRPEPTQGSRSGVLQVGTEFHLNVSGLLRGPLGFCLTFAALLERDTLDWAQTVKTVLPHHHHCQPPPQLTFTPHTPPESWLSCPPTRPRHPPDYCSFLPAKHCKSSNCWCASVAYRLGFLQTC